MQKEMRLDKLKKTKEGKVSDLLATPMTAMTWKFAFCDIKGIIRTKNCF